ncbi:MAG: Gfo/Idh/MocA family oxidoreductase [Kiritimatiellae bacterium]|jgi:predicted dehydrogenase|nr:Gfo/Idh/MocA family oxidoreductase [Kiritimatiellia bacterium]MDD2348842.1 Gfo/Idh/MocA family oxidoreductase [Kiritimatiellia bacterium]MDD3584259.1 Gfo/Idh/MocA family oxidoreductase [Kiritimatiellia bacterium]HON48618.1 Gfo/Idh/MocA family oxidoreductase [Kiritimatiellia bacterium]
MTKLKVGMIGGGGGFFGKVHQRAISLDATREVVAGALHQDPALGAKFANEWGIKSYTDYEAMIADWQAGKLELDYVTIVTPNFLHAEQALACINAGLPVLCEKPMCYTVEEAMAIKKAVRAKKNKVPFAISHTYTGHPQMMLARELVKQGKIGKIRKIETYYNQGWLATLAEKEGNQQASWRTDPKKSGISGCGGDIGTHALINALWTTGLGLKSVSAYLTALPGRKLDDDFNVFGKLSNGGTLVLIASQIAIGHKNDNGFRLFGETGSIEWFQENAEELHYYDGTTRVTYFQNAPTKEVPDVLKSYGRIPAGHHEDFLEALGNLHTSFERKIRKIKGEKNVPPAYDHPGVDEGVLGMKFLKAAVESSKKKGAWTRV